MKALLSLTLLVVSAIGVPVQTGQPELRLTLQLDQTRFRAGEPIKAHITIENRSAVDVVINRRFLINHPSGAHEIFFQILGPDKKLVPFESQVRAFYESREFMRLGTEEVFGKLYDLTGDYDLNKAGEYTITAFYENDQDPPTEMKLRAAWKGRLKSNSVRFVIE